MSSELEIRGVFNFRDLASASPDLRTRLVYRSDGLHRTDRAGADAVAGLGIRRVMDLRSIAEQDREGRFEHPDIETVSAPLVADNTEIGRQFNRGGEDPLLGHYLAMLDDNPGEIARALAIVADSIAEGLPVVFHCTAGKDRTGLLAALLLELAGVPDDLIIDDFHASADGVEQMSKWYESERGETHAEKARQMGIDAAVAQHMMRADRSTMQATLAGLRKRHTDAETYAGSIGVSPIQVSLIHRLRADS